MSGRTALDAVNEFIDLLEDHRTIWRAWNRLGGYEATKMQRQTADTVAEIERKLYAAHPQIADIARHIRPDLTNLICLAYTDNPFRWKFAPTMPQAEMLSGALETRDETKEFLEQMSEQRRVSPEEERYAVAAALYDHGNVFPHPVGLYEIGLPLGL